MAAHPGKPYYALMCVVRGLERIGDISGVLPGDGDHWHHQRIENGIYNHFCKEKR